MNQVENNLQYGIKILTGDDLAKVTSVQNFINLIQSNSVSIALNTSIAQRQTLVSLGLLPNANPLFLRVTRNSVNYLMLECLDFLSSGVWVCEINNGVLGQWTKIMTNIDLNQINLKSPITFIASENIDRVTNKSYTQHGKIYLDISYRNNLEWNNTITSAVGVISQKPKISTTIYGRVDTNVVLAGWCAKDGTLYLTNRSGDTISTEKTISIYCVIADY